MKQQPFYRNKAAIFLRIISLLNLLIFVILALKAIYTAAILGTRFPLVSSLVLFGSLFALFILEGLHSMARIYGNKLYQQHNQEKRD